MSLIARIQDDLKEAMRERDNERREREPQRPGPLAVAGAHRGRELLLDPRDQAHSKPASPPPRMCQCRWKIVWPAPGPTFTITR